MQDKKTSTLLNVHDSVKGRFSSAMSIDLLGQIAWLWVNSPLQKDWPMHLLVTNVIPAIEHQQFLLLKQDDIPVAYCSWAFLDLAAEQRYLADAHGLSLRDWVSGDRMWLIDWVAPFGHSFALYRQMRARFPLSIARAIRVDPEKKTARVQEMMGRSVSKQATAEKFKQYFDEAMSTRLP